ncbi:uncharacterized protein F5147DRAFT_766243 [Suillus discolor]|uniref:Uncharacterized protein n=1 Tax=Suillus discolor TaxID=1912936 RepID=A0A9P7ER38_9AGAM|nr:uncharacterized protein F5147DRAFT_766243 [Suillus discolor]KAG2079603.1 hypothetical protein F5147DRAFT_766243 [Suillus discolor]
MTENLEIRQNSLQKNARAATGLSKDQFVYILPFLGTTIENAGCCNESHEKRERVPTHRSSRKNWGTKGRRVEGRKGSIEVSRRVRTRIGLLSDDSSESTEAERGLALTNVKDSSGDLGKTALVEMQASGYVQSRMGAAFEVRSHTRKLVRLR